MCEISVFCFRFFFGGFACGQREFCLFVCYFLSFLRGFADDDYDYGVVMQARGEQGAKSELRSLVRTSQRCVRFFPLFLATFLLSSS
jgi:hypothetical protein